MSAQLFCTVPFTNTPNQTGMNYFNGYLFLTPTDDGYLYRVSLTNPPVINKLTNIGNLPAGIDNDGTYLYICNNGATGVYRYDINGNKDNSWSSSVPSCWGLIVSGNYIYTSSNKNGLVYQINKSDGTYITWKNLTSYTINLKQLCIINDNMYVVDSRGSGSGNIIKIPIISGTPPTAGASSTFKSGLTFAWGIIGYQNTLFVSFETTNQIIQYNLSGTILNTFTNTGSSCCGIAITSYNNTGVYLFNIVNQNLYSYLIAPNSTNNETLWSSSGVSMPSLSFGFNTLHIFGGYMFLTNGNDTQAGLYRTTFPTPTTWTKTISGGELRGINDDGTYLYLSNTNNTTNISGGFIRCDVNGTIDNSWYAPYYTNYYQFIIKDGYIYTTRYGAGFVSMISIESQTIVNTWANVSSLNNDLSNCNIYGITAVGNNLYVNTNSPSVVVKIPIIDGNPPTSGTITLLDTSSNDPYFSNTGNIPGSFVNYFNKSIIMGFYSISGFGGYTNIIRQYDLGGNLLPTITSSLPVTSPLSSICMNGIYLYAYCLANGNVYQYQLGSVSLAGSFTINGFRYTH